MCVGCLSLLEVFNSLIDFIAGRWVEVTCGRNAKADKTDECAGSLEKIAKRIKTEGVNTQSDKKRDEATSPVIGGSLFFFIEHLEQFIELIGIVDGARYL